MDDRPPRTVYGRPVLVECAIPGCGVLFGVTQSELRAPKRTRLYCSAQCSSVARSAERQRRAIEIAEAKAVEKAVLAAQHAALIATRALEGQRAAEKAARAATMRAQRVAEEVRRLDAEAQRLASEARQLFRKPLQECECGTLFAPWSNGSRYCSHSCSAAAVVRARRTLRAA
jgi:hypothetical protein